MTNKAGARRAQENLYVARQSAAAAAFGRQRDGLRQRAQLAAAREARAITAAKAAARAKTHTATVARDLPARMDVAFAAWTDASTVRAFYGAAGAALGLGELVAVGVDARVGGALHLVWLRDGKRVAQYATFLELRGPTRLALAWDVALPAKERVIITLAPLPAGSRLVLAHELDPSSPGDAADLAPIAAAWETVLDQLSAQLGGQTMARSLLGAGHVP